LHYGFIMARNQKRHSNGLKSEGQRNNYQGLKARKSRTLLRIWSPRTGFPPHPTLRGKREHHEFYKWSPGQSLGHQPIWYILGKSNNAGIADKYYSDHMLVTFSFGGMKLNSHGNNNNLSPHPTLNEHLKLVYIGIKYQ